MLAGASEGTSNSEQDTEQCQDKAKQQQGIWLMERRKDLQPHAYDVRMHVCGVKLPPLDYRNGLRLCIWV